MIHTEGASFLDLVLIGDKESSSVMSVGKDGSENISFPSSLRNLFCPTVTQFRSK